MDDLLDRLSPTLCFNFGGKNPADPGYRTIVGPGASRYESVSFAEQKAAWAAGDDDLLDKAIVYSGECDMRAVILVAGTSSVGTWGAVKYVTTWPTGNDPRWREHLQGVIEVTVKDGREAFEEVSVNRVVEMLSPCEIWLEGSEVACIRPGGQQGILWKPHRKHEVFDLRIFVNGHPIFPNARKHFGAMVLLALARLAAHATGHVVSADAVCEYMYGSFYQGRELADDDCRNLVEFRDAYQNSVCEYLDRLVVQIRGAGGMAEKVVTGGNISYCLVARPLPYALQP